MAKDSFYFSHDHNSRNDPKIQKLLRKHSLAGVGLYWCLIEMLHEQDGYLLLSQCEDYAFALHSDIDLLNSLINNFELFVSDGEKFWSESALLRIEKRKAKSKKASESANLRWKDANALQSQSEGNAIKEIKGKERKGNILLPATKIKKAIEYISTFHNVTVDEDSLLRLWQFFLIKEDTTYYENENKRHTHFLNSLKYEKFNQIAAGLNHGKETPEQAALRHKKALAH